MDTPEKTTAKDILALLRQRYSDGLRYACAAEVRSATSSYDRRFDFVVVNCWPSDGLKIEVFEIKVSKADLKHELEQPEKHNWAFDEIDNYWLVAPEKIVDMDILPKNWGVLVVRDGALFVKRRPIPLHDGKEDFGRINRQFAISLIRSMNNASLERSILDERVREARMNAYAEGRAAGIKEVGNARIDTNKYLWMDSFCHWLGVRSEADSKKKLEEIRNLKLVLENAEWLKNTVENVVSQAKRMKESLSEALEKAKFPIDG